VWSESRFIPSSLTLRYFFFTLCSNFVANLGLLVFWPFFRLSVFLAKQIEQKSVTKNTKKELR